MSGGLTKWSGPWREHDWKIGDKTIWERDRWIELSENAEKVKIFESHMIVHQRMNSTEENFNNQIDKLILSVDTSWPLSLATPAITQ